MRVGLIGLGVISRFYLAALGTRPEVRLAAVCDLDPAALVPLAGTVATYTDHRRMLARERLDAVVVTVPNDAHAEVCRDALDAGSAVCVEKPLALRIEDAATLLGLAGARDVVLFTAFHRRYNAAVRRLRARLPAGVPVEGLTVRYLERIEEHAGPDGWYLDPRRCGGGCVADNGPNAFDLARLFLGEVEVTGAAIERDGRGVDRRARISLRSGTGAAVAVVLDWSYPGECKEVEVRLADGTCHQADMLAGHRGFKGSLWHEYDAVVTDFLTTVAAPPPGPDPGLAALALVDAAYGAELNRVLS